MRPRGSAASRLRKTREGWDFASAAETNSQDQQPRTCPKPLVPINAFGETNSQDQQPRTLTRAECNSTPAVNLDNENPTLTALGKLTHTNPKALGARTDGRTGGRALGADGEARSARHRTVGRRDGGRKMHGPGPLSSKIYRPASHG